MAEDSITGMDCSWVLRSPKEGVHLTIGPAASADGLGEQSVVRLVALQQRKRVGDDLVEVLDSFSLPSRIRAVSWCGNDPQKFAICSSAGLQVVDADYKGNAQRIRHTFKVADPAATGSAGLAWLDAGSGGGLALSQGRTVCIMDAATGREIRSFSHGHADIASTARVCSLVAVSRSEVVACWASTDGAASAASGVIRLCDLRMRMNESNGQTQTIQGGVTGLTCDPFNAHIVAAYSTPLEKDEASVYVWDARSLSARGGVQKPVSRLHGSGSGEQLRLGSIRGLDWSPGKRHTLLALCGEETQPSLLSCILSSVDPPQGSAAAKAWCGQAARLRASSEECVVAACWAHSSSPGAALAMTDGGAYVKFVQPQRRFGVWYGRGGAMVATPWSSCRPGELKESDMEGRSEPRAPTLSRWMEAAGADPCWQMRRWAASFSHNGAESFYAAFGKDPSTSPLTGGIAAAWPWLQAVDQHPREVQPEAPTQATQQQSSWRGALAALRPHVGDIDDMQEMETAPGVFFFASSSRADALQGLGYNEATRPRAERSEDPVQGFLNRILWWQLEKLPSGKAWEQEASVPLEDMAFVLRSARLQLRAKAEQGRQDEHAHDALQWQLKALLDQDWSVAPTLQLALRFVELVVNTCLSGQAAADSTAEDAEQASRKFHDGVFALLGFRQRASAKGDAAADTEEPSVEATKRVTIDERVDNVKLADAEPPAAGDMDGGLVSANAAHSVQPAASGSGSGLLRSLSEEAAVEKTLTDSGVCARFQCAIALRYLPEDRLEDVLAGIYAKTKETGMIEGLCITGLGGSDPPSLDAELRNPQTLLHGMADQGRGGKRTDEPQEPQFKIPDLAAAFSDDGTNFTLACVERTGNVQTAAMLYCLGSSLEQPPYRLAHLYYYYQRLLHRWGLDAERAGLYRLLCERMRRADSKSQKPPVIFCLTCGKAHAGMVAMKSSAKGPQGAEKMVEKMKHTVLRACPSDSCRQGTTKCCVCLMPTNIVGTCKDDDAIESPQPLAVDQWTAYCQKCRHGGHVACLEAWFAKHNACPVAGCGCQCDV
eukprot:TRINITY_DN35112_c0_g2_i1.p1 TRINITY_DN35112_c0_g2~~TRINITY_DN35112_c0_g2_i1.p1  ORF type:complete len:1057 (-),score=239.90 TRINITY_DN35112_c0_g2_i1:59-3229(-)